MIPIWEQHAAEVEAADWDKPGDIIDDYPVADGITSKRFVFNVKATISD